jgi:predicted MPP superfamily phosphohydrolase
LHIGLEIRHAFVDDVVQKTNAMNPDMIVLTGDMVDGSVEHLREHAAPLAALKAKHGVYFVTGNHEYYSGADEWIAEFRRLGIRVLRNERVEIDVPGAGFDLAGIDDWSAHNFGAHHGADLKRALSERDDSRAVILLAHNPKAGEEAIEHGVDLQLSGHTHGGQIWPFNYAVRLTTPWVKGLYQEGNTQIYVSPGTGYWGPPMRLGTTAEITKVVLRSTSA